MLHNGKGSYCRNYGERSRWCSLEEWSWAERKVDGWLHHLACMDEKLGRFISFPGESILWCQDILCWEYQSDVFFRKLESTFIGFPALCLPHSVQLLNQSKGFSLANITDGSHSFSPLERPLLLVPPRCEYVCVHSVGAVGSKPSRMSPRVQGPEARMITGKIVGCFL